MQQQYPFRDIEQQAQQYWQTHQSFAASEASAKPKYYCLSMFPYPSGKLHMGHVRNYTIGDVLSRYHHMRGFNVMQPMGWDAFGLPAENAAIQNNVPPAKWTRDNIAYMRNQLQSLGFAIDWQREIATCDPAYYKWNQWFFLRMLEKGIAYKKTQVVNWDPVDQTVLANEQVIDGRGWRTGAVIEKREIPGYYLNITRYAQELLDDLDKLPGWPERVKTMQANWIGKSTGVRFAFTHDISDSGKLIDDGKLWVFTTRADTVMGVTFCAVAAEHPLATHAAQNNTALVAFIEKCKSGSVMEADMATMEKEGMDTGLTVTHPLTGEQVPVWVGNYVLMSYGEGAVMAVPAHDERDFGFAIKYKLPITPVIAPSSWPADEITTDKDIGHADDGTGERRFSVIRVNGTADKEHSLSWWSWRPIHAEHGICINSGKYDGLNYEQAVDAIAADLSAKDLGEKQTNWRLRDWGVSRQRYWGCPIPIVHCESCGDVPVPDDQLPMVLPEDCVPDGSGNPLKKRENFLHVACPKCGKPAQRETDTMDTFVDSSWYYARYACPDNTDAMVDQRTNYWMPVDQYIGGIEHAILHLLYSRFWTKAMRDTVVNGKALVDYDEPFAHLLTQGMVLNHIFSRRTDKGGIEYFAPEEVELTHDAAGKVNGAKLLADGKPVEFQGMGTMSKSKRNGVDPQALIEQYGADTARLFMMFAAPPEQTLEWSDTGVEGAHRFLRRIWTFAEKNEVTIRWGISENKKITAVQFWNEGKDAPKKLRREIHLLLKQANYDLAKHQFNTVASAAMKMLNTLEQATSDAITHDSRTPPSIDSFALLKAEGLSILLRLLSPIAPHITHSLWRDLGFGDNILSASWPEPLQEAMVQDEVELVIQVNGKLRGSMTVAPSADKAALEKLAVEQPCVQKYLEGGVSVRKIIVVPNKLINIVVG